jgi:hypothetical protein
MPVFSSLAAATTAATIAGVASTGIQTGMAAAGVGQPGPQRTQVGGDSAVQMGTTMGEQSGAQLKPVEEEEQRKPNLFAGGLPGGGGWTA